MEGIPKEVTPAIVTSADIIVIWIQTDPEGEQRCAGRPEGDKTALSCLPFHPQHQKQWLEDATERMGISKPTRLLAFFSEVQL